MGNTQQKTQETEHEHEQKQEGFVFTCEICFKRRLSTRKFKNGNICTHNFCLDCIAKYINVKVTDKIGRIECPWLNCEHPLDPIACRTIITRQMFNRWCDLLCDLAVLDYDRCYCPYRNCSALILNECRNKLMKVDCPNCKRNFCFHCEIPWHGSSYRCGPSQKSGDMNELLSRKLIEDKKWTRCFKCGQPVERVGGCSLVTCRCGARFCHKCRIPQHEGSCGCN